MSRVYRTITIRFNFVDGETPNLPPAEAAKALCEYIVEQLQTTTAHSEVTGAVTEAQTT